MTCFAANSIITRYLVQSGHMPPFILTVIRFVSGFAALAFLAMLMPKTFPKSNLTTSDIIAAVPLGVYAFSISYGYIFIPAGAGTLIFCTFIVTSTATYSVIAQGEKLTTRLVLGQLLSLAGVSLITFSGVSLVTPIGILLMASTGVSWGIYLIYGLKYENSFNYTYNSFLVFGAASCIFLLVSYPLMGEIPTSFTTFGLELTLFMGTVTTALSYVLWQQIMKRIKVYLSGVTQLLVPIFTSIIGVIVLGEVMTPQIIVGGVLVLTGIFLNL
jgi:drug/metabolite transporter (DMT)-like permease